MSVLGSGHVVLLDVGHGNSAVLEDDLGVVVIDAGPGSSLLQHLTDQGIRKIDLVLLSHADQDHIGGLIALLASDFVTVGEVRLNSDALKESALWDDLLYELSNMDENGELRLDVSLTRGQDSDINRGRTVIEVLGPSKYLAGKGPGSGHRSGGRVTSNSISAVLRLVHEGEPRILLTGDVDAIGVADLIEREVKMTAPVLVFPHHGGTSGQKNGAEFTADLLGQVSPSTVVFSFGRLGRGSIKPQKAIIEAIKEPEAPPTHLLPLVAQGRESRLCCAGSMLLSLADPGHVQPELTAHQDFITGAAPTALCR